MATPRIRLTPRESQYHPKNQPFLGGRSMCVCGDVSRANSRDVVDGLFEAAEPGLPSPVTALGEVVDRLFEATYPQRFGPVDRRPVI